jgi:nitroimidazol reductase NimA-like FMN-containing flavoprotein (pyridoxamine 5'-phosphate oxidase superfamily)
MTSRGFDILDAAECEKLLGATHFGRIVTKLGDVVAAFPVFYAMEGKDIVFRTDPGTKLIAAVLHSQVAFEIDDADEGWSVLAVGHCEEVRLHRDAERALNSLEGYWPAGERARVVRIHPERTTGRRLRRPDAF